MARDDDDERRWLHEANGRAERSYAPQLSLSTIISALAFAGSVVYGVWALNQSQLANVNSQIEQLRKDTADKDNRVSNELTRRENELRTINTKQDEAFHTAISTIQAELERRRNEFVNGKEFVEVKDRILDDIKVLRGQLSVIESTRPTTGELQATSNSLRDRIDKLYEMIVSIETWIRTRHPNTPMPPIEAR